jgi:hypothetical protein
MIFGVVDHRLHKGHFYLPCAMISLPSNELTLLAGGAAKPPRYLISTSLINVRSVLT